MNGRRLRVLVTGPSLEGEGAGVQQHVRYLAQAFRDDPAVEVVPFASTSAVYREPWLVKGARLARVYARFPGAANACDVVHVNSTIDRRSVIRDAGLLTRAARAGRSAVLQFHGGGLHRLGGLLQGPPAARIGRALRSANEVLFLSEAQAAPVAEHFGLERVGYVGNYVDTGVAPADRTGRTGLRVAYLGRLDFAKGPVEAVQGFLKAAGPDWDLRIAGAGPAESAAREAAGGDTRVGFLGFIGAGERAELLAWADVLVLPSAHDEGLPYAVLEAAAAGVVPVTSSRGGLTRAVRDGRTGLIVPERDTEALSSALSRLGGDRETLGEMSARARAMVVEEFSFDAMRSVFSDIWMRAAGRAQ